MNNVSKKGRSCGESGLEKAFLGKGRGSRMACTKALRQQQNQKNTVAWTLRASGRRERSLEGRDEVFDFYPKMTVPAVWKRALKGAGAEAETPEKLGCSQPKVLVTQTTGG